MKHFYGDLHNTLNNISSFNLLLVLGDLNPKEHT